MILGIRHALQKIFPIFGWSRSYTTADGVADLVAGITVALTLIPQSIAYASLAGLEPQYGLYSSFAGSLVYILLGTTPEVNIGPTALLSLLTFTYTGRTSPDFAVLLCFIGGLVQLIVGFSRLGFLVEFVSLPVVSGFTSAAALIIACSQIKGLLGLNFKAESFLKTWEALGDNIGHARMGDTILSVVCCIVLLAMRQLKEIKIKPKNGKMMTKTQERLQSGIWFISVGRNAAVVVVCAVVAYILDSRQSTAIKLTGQIVAGLPRVGLPKFTSSVGNVTYSFTEMSQHLGSGLVVVPLIGIIANVAIAKAFAKGRVLDASQEIIALGVCNVVSSFFQSIPVNGSFSRSAVSNASGVRTPAAGLYTGIIVLMTLGFLTPYFYYIPKAALSSVIICAVTFMIDLRIVKDLWRSGKLELIPLCGTFVACLFLGVEIGILVGIAIDIMILLYFNARPRLLVENVKFTTNSYYTVAVPTGGLFFPSTNYVREIIETCPEDKEMCHGNQLKPVIVIDCTNLQRTDWTSLQGLKSLISDFKKVDKTIIFLNCRSSLLIQLSSEIGDNFLHSSTYRDLKNMLNDYLITKEPVLSAPVTAEIKLDVLEPKTSDVENS